MFRSSNIQSDFGPKLAWVSIGWLAWLCLGGSLAAESRGPGPATVAKPTKESDAAEMSLGVGRWIWTTNFADKQSCRLWRAFTIPATNIVRKAILRLTVDNFYRVFLDGRAISQGGSYTTLTEYDLTWLLSPGQHVLAVEAFNDAYEAGLICGLRIEFAGGGGLSINSDKSWYVVSESARRWTRRMTPDPHWSHAVEVGAIGQYPWKDWPGSIVALAPLRPEPSYFWETGWFLVTVLTIAGVALILSMRLATKLAVQIRAQKLLDRERTLIARDIHDDLGAGLTQLVLQAEVAQTEFPSDSAARERLNQLADKARGVSHSLEEVLWAVNSKRDTLRDFTSYLCKYAQSFLATTGIRCRLDVQPEMPASAFDLPVRRSLFLAIKEALNNAAKHSGATELFLRIRREKHSVTVIVEDNGRGFDATQPTEGNGLNNMEQRLVEMGGECRVFSEPSRGCVVEFKMPLLHPIRRAPWWKRLFQSDPPPVTDPHPEP